MKNVFQELDLKLHNRVQLLNKILDLLSF
uniref:Uncharacterized protein n=1 Tax=Rhizophora mucronata TaxID=61149 RepID=A0A2P2NUZ8_RHIMU